MLMLSEGDNIVRIQMQCHNLDILTKLLFRGSKNPRNVENITDV